MFEASLLKRRGDFTLQVDFQAPTPGVVALFGPSGCGKTTVVDLVSGLLEPDSGRVRVDGTILTDTREAISVPVEQRRIGYVFQDARLFPHFTVLGNLRYGQRRAPTDAHVIGMEQVVDLLGIGTLLGRRPHELSGGERQRVALGRALLSQPRLLLLDEPLAGLDIARREEVLPYLELLRDRMSIPMIYVSHQFDEVLRLATHVVLLEAGRVVGQGTLNDVSLIPQLRRIVGPDAVGAVLDGRVTRVDAARGLVDVELGTGTLHVSMRDARVGSRLRVQLLARDIILAIEPPKGLSVRNALAGTISTLVKEEHDDAVLVQLDIGGPALLARVTQDAVDALQLAPGVRAWALVKAVSMRGHAFHLGYLGL
jgi:molybdate transport system ATP-binding protein